MDFFRNITSGNFKMPKLHQESDDTIKNMADQIDRMEKMLIHANKGDLPKHILDLVMDIKGKTKEDKNEGKDDIDSKKKQTTKAEDLWTKLRKDVKNKAAIKRLDKIEWNGMKMKSLIQSLFWFNDSDTSPAG